MPVVQWYSAVLDSTLSPFQVSALGGPENLQSLPTKGICGSRTKMAAITSSSNSVQRRWWGSSTTFQRSPPLNHTRCCSAVVLVEAFLGKRLSWVTCNPTRLCNRGSKIWPKRKAFDYFIVLKSPASSLSTSWTVLPLPRTQSSCSASRSSSCSSPLDSSSSSLSSASPSSTAA